MAYGLYTASASSRTSRPSNPNSFAPESFSSEATPRAATRNWFPAEEARSFSWRNGPSFGSRHVPSLVAEPALLEPFEADNATAAELHDSFASVSAEDQGQRPSTCRRVIQTLCGQHPSRIELQVGLGLGLVLASLGLLFATVDILLAVALAIMGGVLGFSLGRRLGRLVQPPAVQARPQNRAALGKLPSRIVSTSQTTLNGSAEACSVCLEEFRRGDDQRRLPCLHAFHRSCVDDWLVSNGACPVCRHSVIVNSVADTVNSSAVSSPINEAN